MKATLKNWIGLGVELVVNFIERRQFRFYFSDKILDRAINRTQSVKYGDTNLVFTVPNTLNHFRVDTFETKEPETLEWIDAIPEGSVLWDIGANIGLYTCYAAKARQCQVFAFEPSVFNLELLARNIFLNRLSRQVTIIPVPLTYELTQSTLNMTTTAWGGALSTFGQDYGDDGQSLDKVFEFRTLGISMVDAVQAFKLKPPDFVKMDVDGIEHLILKGGIEVLKGVKGVLVEVNEYFEQQAIDSSNYLETAGLTLKEKRRSNMFDATRFDRTYNQIWYRSSSL